MATVLEGIGKAVKGVLPKKEEYSFDKNQLLSIIDNSLACVDAAMIPATVDFDGIFRSNKKEETADFEAAHRVYMSGLHQHERSYFEKLKQALSLMKTDLEMIREKFQELFSHGTNPSEVTLEQMKVSHTAILGYIKSVEIVCSWFCYMVSLIPTEKDAKPPQYRVKFVKENAKRVGEAVGHVLARGRGKTIVDDIKALGADGRDVFLTSNGMTIDEYAHDTDYPKAVRGYVQEFSTWNILFWATDTYNSFFRWLYDERKAMREWMLAKVAMLKLQQQGVQPTDPEYERLEKIIQNYGNLIAQYDKKIADYENEA